MKTYTLFGQIRNSAFLHPLSGHPKWHYHYKLHFKGISRLECKLGTSVSHRWATMTTHFSEVFTAANLATKQGFEVEFEARRGVRVVYGAALEKRSPCIAERGFESHPLRHIIKNANLANFIITIEYN